jgi:anti-sigma regulatory factor (Ser/Thr protein kinase)
MTDAVSLTVPYARPYYAVVRLVVGGLAARLNLPYEQLEDVQIALESVLTNEAYAAGDDVTVDVRRADAAVEVVIGPLDARALGSDLDRELDERGGVDLRRLLTTLMGRFEVDDRDGAYWLRMTKDLPTREPTTAECARRTRPTESSSVATTSAGMSRRENG